MKMIQVSEDALNSIKAMAEQDAKDAARYRWIREQGERIIPKDSFRLMAAFRYWTDQESLDSAIDAAMQTK